ncbi:autotransporter translocation and assembly factor TamB [Hydrogenivirga caldilitoris]|uniref:Autotransporter translocation and assembly factor TamB n=1 Tax=Hydrogenivirga caldilitoris TaxID=246264 RepID=A0A497XMV8_9AQUI|nr:translocation/assembly module TamB domain-containing protein [Hydrogenivirga caldilitoris]RLJ70277.1 autotransporter translocation and assembly factor TamB [Hydrogenivirga caldilitoris]
MRYVAFLLLLLLSLYFFLIKPYLIAKRIYFKFEGVELNLSPFYLKAGLIYFYIPFQGRYVFLNLTDLSFELDERPNLSLKEGNFTVVETGTSINVEEKERKAPYIFVPEFLKTTQIYVGKFLFNYLGKTNLSVLAENFSLKDRVISGNLDVISGSREFSIKIKRMRLLEDTISLDSVDVNSDLFSFSLRGTFQEGEPEARFSLVGGIRGLDFGNVYVAPVKLNGRGRANYKGINVLLSAETDSVLLKGRKTFSKVRASGLLSLTFGKELSLRGRIENPVVKGDYNLELAPHRRLSLKIERFPIDSELLGVKPFLFSWVRGDLKLDMDEGSLSLYATTDGFDVENYAFNRTEMFLDYSYKLNKGKVELAVRNPAETCLSGNLEGGSFKSELLAKDILLVMYGASTFLSYQGKLNYEGDLILSGEGTLKDSFYQNLPLGDVDYKLSYGKGSVDLDYSGRGFSGSLLGSTVGGFISITDFKDFRGSFRGYGLSVREGKLEVALQDKNLALVLSLEDAKFSKDDLNASVQGELKLFKSKELQGKFWLVSRDVSFGDKSFKEEMSLTGELTQNLVSGSYEVKGYLNGVYSFNLQNMHLRSTGNLAWQFLKADFSLEGTPEEGTLNSKVEIRTGDKPVATELTASYSGRTLKLRLDPASYTYKVSKIEFGGAKLRVDGDKGSVELGDTSISILGRPVVVFKQDESVLDLGRGLFKLTLVSSGALQGKAEVFYSKDKGLHVLSSGSLDLDRLSFFITTPVGGKAKGLLDYQFSYRGGNLSFLLKNEGKLVSYSRYFAFPMDAAIELKALDRSLSAFITVWRNSSGFSANVGSNNLKDYYIYLVSRELPVAYRTPSLSARLDVSSEGWVRVSNLKEVSVTLDALLSGELEILKAELERKGERQPSKTEVELDVRFDTFKPIRVQLPEGYLFVKVKGWVQGKSSDPNYALNIEFLTGELTYFGRRFFVKGGHANLLKEQEVEEKRIDISLVNPSEDMSIFINLKGSLDNPQIVVWSEPPKSSQEILTKLVIGSTAEGLIPVAKTLFKQLGYLGSARSGLASLLGVDITLSTQTGSQGEIGINLNVRKKIAEAFSIEYQQSTLKDPRATYYGGSLTFPGGTYFYGRIFADNTSEIKLRFIRKFDF